MANLLIALLKDFDLISSISNLKDCPHKKGSDTHGWCSKGGPEKKKVPDLNTAPPFYDSDSDVTAIDEESSPLKEPLRNLDSESEDDISSQCPQKYPKLDDDITSALKVPVGVPDRKLSRHLVPHLHRQRRPPRGHRPLLSLREIRVERTLDLFPIY
ncbi:hypothetical protein IRJ41_009009, partial [Triplophysa rosa]